MLRTRLKRVAQLRAGGTPQVDDPRNWAEDPDAGIPWVSISDMSDGATVVAASRKVSEEGLAAKGLPVGEAGTLLFAMYASVGAVAELGISASWSQALLAIEPRPGLAHRRFIRYWLEHLRADLGALVRSNTQDNLNAEQVGNFPFPVLSVLQQRAIADYLDAETARIDALIAKKQRMVELLEDRTRGRIAEATRRGIDASSPMKNSGLEWVGQIPAHWDVVPNRAAMRLVREPVVPGNEPVLLSLTRGGVVVRDTSENKGKFPASFDSYQIVHERDLVFCLFDIPETPRTVGISPRTGMVTGAYAAFRARRSVLPEYINYLYLGFDDEKSLSLFYTGLRKVIRPDTFLGIRMPLPPVREQGEIVDHLTLWVGKDRKAIEALSKQIALLRERRQALITAAVTGELDISEVAA